MRLNFFRTLAAEAGKHLHRQAVLLMVAGPLSLAVLTGIGVSILKIDVSWASLMRTALVLWAGFLAPMAAAAVAVYFAQMEHRSSNLQHLHLLPISRPALYGAKALLLMLTTLIAHAITPVAVFAAVLVGTHLNAAVELSGPIPWPQAIQWLGVLWLASTCYTAIQYWVSLQFSGVVAFVVAMLGVGVTIASILVPSLARWYAPWSMPYMLLTSAAQWSVVVLVSLVAGVVVFAASSLMLSVREFSSGSK